MDPISDFAPSPSTPTSRGPDRALPQDPVALAALSRDGCALAYAALSCRCQRGAPRERAAAIRQLPGLVPFQPVRRLMCALWSQRPSPPAVRHAVLEARGLLDDPHDRERTYRAIQQVLQTRFCSAEEQRLRRARAAGARRGAGGPLTLREQLDASAAVVNGLYDYRFAWSDGSIGDLQARQVEEYLLDYAPRHLLLAPALRAQAPRLLARYLSWQGQVGHLLPQRGRALAILALALARRYDDQIAAATPGALDSLAAARRAAVPLDDPAALQRFHRLHRLELLDELAPLFE